MIHRAVTRQVSWPGIVILCSAFAISGCRTERTHAAGGGSVVAPRTYRQWLSLWQDEFGEGRRRIKKLLLSRPLRYAEVEILLGGGGNAVRSDAWDMVRLNLQHYDVYPQILSLGDQLSPNTLPNLLPGNDIQAERLERAALSCPAMQSRVAMDLCAFHGIGHLRVLRTLAAKGTPATVETIYMNSGLMNSNVSADLTLFKAIIGRAKEPGLKRTLKDCGRALGTELLESENEKQLASFVAGLSEGGNRDLVLRARSVKEFISSVRKLRDAAKRKKPAGAPSSRD